MEETQKQGEKVTLEFTRTTLWQIISGVFAVLLVVSIFTSGFGFGSKSGNSGTGAAVVNNNAGNQPIIPTGPVDVSAGTGALLGDKNAKVTVIEFSDFQCPFCERFFTQTFDQIKTNYIDTGKIKFVYRNFPLSSIHPMAESGAEAAECAKEQGKFWEYHNVLFQKQTEWTVTGVPTLKQYAKDLGLDSSKFDSCLDTHKYQQDISKDLNDGAAAGVQGTPSFFINGNIVSGAQPYSAFQAAIDQALKS